MSIGSKVRRMFGRHERLVSELWRAAFINLDQFVKQLCEWVPNPGTILEIGCGEGAGTERLASSYPNASILAIDIAPNLGRLYSGPRDRVAFRQIAVTELANAQGGEFDLIVMCDVLHHIPPEMRSDIIAAARTLLAPGGSFVFKDWARTATPIHWIAYAADRWLTGDRIGYATPAEAESLFAATFGESAIREQATIRPWRNNFALLLQAQA
jgi:2-polyprenyl-6-hydroxyphenyl methylase/3-demethylubiquinone-9 3-methyltransferase